MPKVEFGKPSRNVLNLCLPSANIAVVTFLHSTGELLGGLGEKGLFDVIEKIVQELLDNTKVASN